MTDRQIFEAWYAMNVLIRPGFDISGVITHRFPVTEFVETLVITGDGRSGEAVMR